MADNNRVRISSRSENNPKKASGCRWCSAVEIIPDREAYVDDDDVLARSKESAEDTQVKPDEATEELGIKINRDKTKITLDFGSKQFVMCRLTHCLRLCAVSIFSYKVREF